MPFGPVFTSSSGGSIGGPLPFTRIRGQLLVGQSPEPPASGSQTGTQPGGASGYNGSAAAPLYSFYNRPDAGIYAKTVTSSAGAIADIRWSIDTNDVFSVSTENLRGAVNGSAAIPMYAFVNSSGVGAYLYSSANAGALGLSAGKLAIGGVSTAGVFISATSGASTGGVYSTAATQPTFYIPQTTAAIAASSDGGPAPAAVNASVALVYDSARAKLCIYSTINAAWMCTAAMTSS